MRVYERRPSGLSVAELSAQATRDPGAARRAAARGIVGVALVACVALPFGLLWLLLGAGLLGSMVLFARDAAAGAIERPSLVLRGRPKWDGVTRTHWSIEADDPVAVGRRLAERLDDALGESLTAFDRGDANEGTTRRQAFSADATAPAIVAWSTRDRPRLAAAGDADGVWLRIEPSPPDGGAAKVTVLANDGPATAALTQAAWRA